jgi:hypothetical protein
MHGTNVVTWMSLKNVTLGQFARIEEDCFVKTSIWAQALKKRRRR